VENLVKIGRLNKTFGLKGHIRFSIEPQFLSRLKKLEVIFLTTGNKSLPYFPDQIELDESGRGMLHFEEVKDKTAADFLVGKEIFIEEKFLKKRKAFEWVAHSVDTRVFQHSAAPFPDAACQPRVC